MSININTSQQIQTLVKQLPTCMLVDRFPLRNRLNQARTLSEQNKPVEKSLNEVAQKIRSSQAKYAARLKNLPKPEYPLELPVSGRKAEISEAISKNQVVIVCGEPVSPHTITT